MLNLYHSLIQVHTATRLFPYYDGVCIIMNNNLLTSHLSRLYTASQESMQESTNSKKSIRLKQRAPLSYKPDANVLRHYL